MKKFFAALLLLFFAGTGSCYAFSELYYFKNIKPADVETFVSSSMVNSGFSVVKSNPYYGVSQKGDDYAVVILQASGENMFYYYQAERNTKINKAILKEMKKQNIVVEQSFNTSLIGIYDNLAEELVKGSGFKSRYTFEDEPVVLEKTNVQKSQVQTPQTYSGYVTQINAGTKLDVYLQNAINTATASKGDQVIAVVSNPLVYNGTTLIPQGSLVYGTLSNARSASYGSRNGRIVINFNQIVTPENQVYNIAAEEVDFAVSNDGKGVEVAKTVATRAAVGALLGMLVALCTDNSVGKGAAIGAGVGGGAGVVTTVAEKGVDAEIPSFTELEITLTQPFNVSVSR